jgi:hypothetical protein
MQPVLIDGASVIDCGTGVFGRVAPSSCGGVMDGERSLYYLPGRIRLRRRNCVHVHSQPCSVHWGTVRCPFGSYVHRPASQMRSSWPQHNKPIVAVGLMPRVDMVSI